MGTYFAIIMLFKEFVIEGLLLDSDDFKKALGIIAIPWGLCMIIMFAILDIVLIPFYILVGIIWLIIKGIRLIVGD